MKKGLFLTVMAAIAAVMFFFNTSTAPAFEKTEAKIVQAKIVPGGWEVVVVPGDTLSYLTSRYSSLNDNQFIAELNGISTAEVLKPGKKLFLPFAWRMVTTKNGKVIDRSKWTIDEDGIKNEARMGNILLPSLRHKVERKK
jgi:hypothetical protein